MSEGSDEVIGHANGKPVYRQGYRREDGVWVCPSLAIPERETMTLLPHRFSGVSRRINRIESIGK